MTHFYIVSKQILVKDGSIYLYLLFCLSYEWKSDMSSFPTDYFCPQGRSAVGNGRADLAAMSLSSNPTAVVQLLPYLRHKCEVLRDGKTGFWQPVG